MRRAIPPVLAFVSVFLWVACDSAPPTQPMDVYPSFEISDGAHQGNEHFFWLPPMVENPATAGTFDGGLDPIVLICMVDQTCTPEEEGVNYLLRYTRNTSPSVLVDVHGQHYQLNWDTDDLNESDGNEFRISVWFATTPLGHADVRIDKTAKNFQHLSNVVGLIDGRTLPIKFRIEKEMFDLSFHSNAEGSFDIYVMNSKTGNRVNVTPSPSLDGTPNWSPDGSKIVFASDRTEMGGPLDIYVMNADGSDVQLLAKNGWQPEYSPDGSKIAFQRGWPPEGCDVDNPLCDPYDNYGRHHDVWIMDADGGNEVQLTDVRPPGAPDPFEDHGPTWHPTENWVTFARYRNPVDVDGIPGEDPCIGPYNQLWLGWDHPNSFCAFDIVSVDVSEPGNLEWIRHTFILQFDQLNPRWSPDGQFLAYQGGASPGQLNALTPVPLHAPAPIDWRFLALNDEGDDQNPSWSSSGEVVYTSERSWGSAIFLVDNWEEWWAAGTGGQGGYNDYPRTQLIGGPGSLSGWARFRPE